MEDIAILLIVFSVPLSFIWARTWLKVRTVDAETGGARLREQILKLEEDNKDLRRRMEVLETIAINSDVRREGIAGARALDEASVTVNELATAGRGRGAR
jgi:hypothetical protein